MIRRIVVVLIALCLVSGAAWYVYAQTHAAGRGFVAHPLPPTMTDDQIGQYAVDLTAARGITVVSGQPRVILVRRGAAALPDFQAIYPHWGQPVDLKAASIGRPGGEGDSSTIYSDMKAPDHYLLVVMQGDFDIAAIYHALTPASTWNTHFAYLSYILDADTGLPQTDIASHNGRELHADLPDPALASLP